MGVITLDAAESHTSVGTVETCWPDWPVHALVDDVGPRLRRAFERGESVALATLVRVDGSAPRRPGAQMLIGADGAITGAISGGCVEAAVAAEAQAQFKSRHPKILHYGTGSPCIDIRLTCGAAIRVAIEVLAPMDRAAHRWLEATTSRREVLWIASLDGARWAGAPDATEHDMPTDPTLQAAFVLARDSRESAGWTGATWWVRHRPRVRLLINGGDAVALALCDIAVAAGYEVILNRLLGPPRAPNASIDYWRLDPGLAVKQVGLDPQTAVVTTTHDDEDDRQLLDVALHSDALYVGALGSRRRRGARLERLRKEGLTDAQLARLRNPVGLNIGAATPQEIAISILADIIAHHRRHHAE